MARGELRAGEEQVGVTGMAEGMAAAGAEVPPLFDERGVRGAGVAKTGADSEAGGTVPIKWGRGWGRAAAQAEAGKEEDIRVVDWASD